jgi:uncharacterized phage protein gp47/JayE
VSERTVVPGTAACGCCEGVDSRTPAVIENRAGLSAIAYRIGQHSDFRESMIAGLSSSEFAALAALRTREHDDFTIGLIDAVACAADVLTFYQERIANESYLRTSTERVSLQELARLIGYRLRPGVAAETWLAFALEPPRTPPPGLPPDPGAFVTGIPAALSLPVGLQVKSVPGPDETPQTFETVESVDARPAWNAVRPWLSEVRAPGYGAIDTWLQGVGTNLKPGDAVVFVGYEYLANPTTNNNWDFRIVDGVEPDAANDRTRVTWARGLGSVSPYSNPPTSPQVFALRKRAGVFGHNAPLWRSMPAQFREDYAGTTGFQTLAAPPAVVIGQQLENVIVIGIGTITEWPAFTISPKTTTASGGYVDLDAVAGDIPSGGLAVLAKGDFNRPDENYPADTYIELYQVTSTSEESRAQFAMSGKVTRLGLRGQNLAEQFHGHPRATSVFAKSELLPLARYPVTTAVSGDDVPLEVPAEALEAGRRLIVVGRHASSGVAMAHTATIVSATSVTNGSIVTITPPLPAPLQRDSVVVHLNVALATHGETVAQVLGAGDASLAFQRFELKRLPLTYRSATNETGADSELTIRVGDVEWAERDTMFGSEPTDRAYTVETDEQERTWVVFGDGVRGSRLPTGVNNVRATYRQGIGQAGNVDADGLTQLITRPLGLKSVSNPVAALGGTDPEPAEQARQTMPLGARTLGRAVSLVDYEDFALAFTGIAKAQARVLQLPAGPTIAVTIAGQDGAALGANDPIRQNLWLALKASGDPHVNVVLLSYQASTFRLGLKVKRDPAYAIAPLLAAVDAALRAHYAFDRRGLADPVLQSDVIAVVHAVPGVVAVDLDFLYGGTSPPSQTVKSRQARLLASAMRVSGSVPLAAELLTLAPAPLDRLEEML